MLSAAPEPSATAVKILVAGGFGVGKTTFVSSASEIAGVYTDEVLTVASQGSDRLGGVEDKTTTTVALDFGRITIDETLRLYLFGTPGQERFWFLWDELATGAVGAVVLTDTRRFADSFSAVDYFENRGITFLVAVNQFDGSFYYDPDEVRAALNLRPDVPVVLCDARSRRSATDALVSLIRHLLAAAALSTS